MRWRIALLIVSMFIVFAGTHLSTDRPLSDEAALSLEAAQPMERSLPWWVGAGAVSLVVAIFVVALGSIPQGASDTLPFGVKQVRGLYLRVRYATKASEGERNGRSGYLRSLSRSRATMIVPEHLDKGRRLALSLQATGTPRTDDKSIHVSVVSCRKLTKDGAWQIARLKIAHAPEDEAEVTSALEVLALPGMHPTS